MFIIAQIDTRSEPLEVNDYQKDQYSSKHAINIGQRISEKGILNCTKFIASENCAVKEFDESAFVLFSFSLSSSSFIRKRRETAPKDSLCHIDSDEKTCSGVTNTVSLGHHIVQKNNNDGS